MIGIGLGLQHAALLASVGWSISASVIDVIDTAGTADSNPPSFDITLNADHVVGDVLRLQFSQDDFATSTAYTHTLVSGDLVYPYAITWTGVAALAGGSWKARMRVERGSTLGTWSNVETFQCPITLSSPTAAKSGTTTATGGVTTSIAGGTLYAVVTTSATAPTAAQVKAGQDHTGAAAAAAKSQVVAASGAQTVSGGFTGLSPSTTYYAHFVQSSGGVDSNVASYTTGFTTDAAFSLTWTDGKVEASGGTTITYTACAIGSANANRVVAVAIAARMTSGNSISSVTIGGVSAIEVIGARATNGGTNGSNSGIWYASVPSGTTANVVATYSAATSRTGIGVYSVVTGTPAPNDSKSLSTTTSPATVPTIVVPTNGGAIVCDWLGSVSAATTWTNASTDYTALAGGSSRFTAATASGTGSVSITASNQNGQAQVLSAAAWGP